MHLYYTCSSTHVRWSMSVMMVEHDVDDDGDGEWCMMMITIHDYYGGWWWMIMEDDDDHHHDDIW